MKPRAQFTTALLKHLPVAGFLLVGILLIGIHADSQDIVGPQLRLDGIDVALTSRDLPSASREISSRDIAHYAMALDGDRSVDLATVVEQPFSGYTRYIVRLQLASGAEQAVAVAAPPGGLRLEMRDMSGDNVPNDLILTPRLIAWPPTVLLNNGHDHFEVAVTAGFPRSLGSDDDRASRPQDNHAPVSMISSGPEAFGITNGQGLLVPQLAKYLLSSITPSFATRLDYASSSGRAPPHGRNNA
jgi:hypothetical protein